MYHNAFTCIKNMRLNVQNPFYRNRQLATKTNINKILRNVNGNLLIQFIRYSVEIYEVVSDQIRVIS